MRKIIEKASVIFKEVGDNDVYEVLKSRDGQLKLGGKYSRDFAEFYMQTNEDVVFLYGELSFEPVAEFLKVGDYVKTLTESKHGTIKSGEFAVIKNMSVRDHIICESLTNKTHNGIFSLSQLTKATIEEVKWAKIGRKPNELKVGDIVERSPGYFDVVANPHGGLRLDSGEKLIAPAEVRFDGE